MVFIRIDHLENLKESKRHVITLRFRNEYQTLVLFRMESLAEDGNINIKEFYALVCLY